MNRSDLDSDADRIPLQQQLFGKEIGKPLNF